MIYVLILINMQSIEIECKLFTILRLNLLHLSVITERKMMQSVSEIELTTTHIEFLDYLTKGMR